MFDKLELIEFNFDDDLYYYTIITTDNYVDMSIFSPEEIN